MTSITDAEMLFMLLALGSDLDVTRQFLVAQANLSTLPIPPPTATVNGDWNLREGPSTTYESIGGAAHGTLWERHGQQDGWYLVRDMTQTRAGWLNARAFDG